MNLPPSRLSNHLSQHQPPHPHPSIAPFNILLLPSRPSLTPQRSPYPKYSTHRTALNIPYINLHSNPLTTIITTPIPPIPNSKPLKQPTTAPHRHHLPQSSPTPLAFPSHSHSNSKSEVHNSSPSPSKSNIHNPSPSNPPPLPNSVQNPSHHTFHSLPPNPASPSQQRNPEPQQAFPRICGYQCSCVVILPHACMERRMIACRSRFLCSRGSIKVNLD